MKEIINDEQNDEPRILYIGKYNSVIQIQIQQDGLDAYLNMSHSEARHFIGELDKLVNVQSKG